MTQRNLVRLNALVATCAVIALAISLLAIQGRISDLAHSRVVAQRETCHVIYKALIDVSTPQQRRGIFHSLLNDCPAYGRLGTPGHNHP